MKNILISTIVRNREKFLKNWINQLNGLIDLRPNVGFYISVYENDSSDDSKNLLSNLDYSKFKGHKIFCENLGTPSFGSIKNDLRVKLLSEARNKSIYNNSFLNECNYVISVEPDIFYDPSKIVSIIDDDDFDILSPRSIEYIPPAKNHIYDGWGTRNTERHLDWEANIDFKDKIQVWTTYNCFCKYNSIPIKNNISFGWYNERLGIADCDTAVICENFRKKGFNKIYLDGSVSVLHMR